MLKGFLIIFFLQNVNPLAALLAPVYCIYGR